MTLYRPISESATILTFPRESKAAQAYQTDTPLAAKRALDDAIAIYGNEDTIMYEKALDAICEGRAAFWTAAGYSNAELDRIDEQMVFARNADWIPKLEKMFASGNVFVVVGADHLSGPRGVVALLEKRGFKLTRITD